VKGLSGGWADRRPSIDQVIPECKGYGVCPVGCSEFLEQCPEVGLDRRFREVKRIGNLLRGLTVGDQLQHFLIRFADSILDHAPRRFMNTPSHHVSIAVVVLAIAVLALSGCSASEGQDHEGDDHGQGLLLVTGTVIDVVGDLSTITGVTLLTEDGEQVDFIPAPDALFDGGPISHIRDHLVSGAPVQFEYRELNDGTLVAIELGDAHG